MIHLNFDSAPDRSAKRDLTDYLDDDGVIRRCVQQLTQALLGLLGDLQGPELAAKLRELGALAREVGEVCDERAKQVDHIDGSVQT